MKCQETELTFAHDRFARATAVEFRPRKSNIQYAVYTATSHISPNQKKK